MAKINNVVRIIEFNNETEFYYLIENDLTSYMDEPDSRCYKLKNIQLAIGNNVITTLNGNIELLTEDRGKFLGMAAYQCNFYCDMYAVEAFCRMAFRHEVAVWRKFRLAKKCKRRAVCGNKVGPTSCPIGCGCNQ